MQCNRFVASVLVWLVPVLVLMGMAAPEASARPSGKSFYSTTASDLKWPAGTLLKNEPLKLPAFYRAKAWRIMYVTKDYRGRPLVSTGTVVLPDYAAKQKELRTIVAWAHPTVGIARHCAPSLRQGPRDYVLGLNELVSSGHIVASTDYPGLGTPGPMGYLVGKGQAYAMIDAVRAARQIPEVGGGNRYALWGYSQGGHAALFAAQLSRSYAPELVPVGVAAVAPPTDLGSLLRAISDTTSGRVLTSFTLGSWSRKYGLPITSVADPNAVRTIDEVNRSCLTDFADLMDIASADSELAKRFLARDPLKAPDWSQLIAENSMFNLSAGIPVLILQGELDQIVKPAVTVQFVRTTCRNRMPVKLTMIKKKGHGGAAKASVGEAVGWMNDRFRGKPAPSSCR
jgi:pimeloyl-ACP methyl ester carboxylesterase